MSSNELPRIGPETLAVYGSGREIKRWSHTCTHWMGEEYPLSGPTRYVALSTEGAALHWLATGLMAEGVREINEEEARLGCACARQGEQPSLLALELAQGKAH